MRAAELTVVDADGWREHVARLRDRGFTWLDFLTAVDRGTSIEIVIRLVDIHTGGATMAVTSIPADEPDLDSVVQVAPGADWYEREAAEMFGITFTGHPDPRPLLTRGEGPPPLRKSVPLVARLHTAWPGADPDAPQGGSRRRAQPPGVLDTWERA